MSISPEERLRELLDESERERAALRQSLEGVQDFQKLAAAVGASDDPSNIVDTLVATLGHVVPWLAATVRLERAEGGRREVFRQGLVPAAEDAFRELEEDAVVRCAMESHRPMLVPSHDGPGGREWIIVPLVVRNRPVGLVGMIPALPGGEVTGHRMEMLRLVASQAAAALDNLGHIEVARRNEAELHGLYRIAKRLGGTLDAGRLFDIAAEAVSERWNRALVAMSWTGPDPRCYASGGAAEDCLPLLGLEVQIGSPRAIGQLLSHGQDLRKIGAAGAILVGLGIEGRRLGSFLVASPDEDFAESREAGEWLGAVGRLLSGALENARLYEELVGSNRRLGELQERMVRAGRLAAVGQLAGGIAHEINNPLQVILGRVQILQMRCGATAENVLLDLKRVESETMRIAQIVRGMQEFARQQPESRELAPLALAQIVDAVVELVGFRFRRHRIEIVREGFDSSPIVLGDADELKHLVLNLSLNALQAIGEGGEIVYRLACADGCAVLEVSDTGSGISPEDLERIFDPFFRRREGGTGLGLASCYSIVRRHGGTIHAVPNLARGAMIRVLLPLQEPDRKS